ncbi:MAG: VacJ family lipoprotein [Deltaproteobacteria bacterium]|nr:VacJ family lipoprotein [Deltaproteobacteria bacterium]
MTQSTGAMRLTEITSPQGAPVHQFMVALRAGLLSALTLITLLGCAHPTQTRDWSQYEGPGAEHFQREELTFPDVSDPLEPFNRSIDAGNRFLLSYLLDPLATVWRAVTPDSFRASLVRAMQNLGYPVRLVNNLLQGKLRPAGIETARFLTNTTLGLAGLFDPARSWWGLRPFKEDMGQTFAHWGWRNSTFLSLPIWGPSTVRDGLGTIGDIPLDPTTYVFLAGPVKTFITSADHVEQAERLMRTHYDAYHAIRYVWVLNRRAAIIDLEPSLEPSSASETLETIYFEHFDDWFPRRARTHRVEIPSTGRKLPYQVWMQREPAPMLYLLPGLGGHRDGASMIALAELAFLRGFSVAVISSALNFEFMLHAATNDVPGFPPADARDVHAALDAVDRDLVRRHPDRITGRALMGISMGAFHTLFIAADEEQGATSLVRFDRYVALYPPVRLRHGMEQLDAFYNAPLAFPEEEREERVVGILQKVLRSSGELDLQPGTPIPLSQLEAEFLIGVAFRMTLHDMIWVSQMRNDMGILTTPRSQFRRSGASREILEFSFIEYLYAFALPYFSERKPEIRSVEDLFARADLHDIAPLLKVNADKIRVFANENDFLVSSEDVTWLTNLLGEQRVTFYPGGGHMGNLHIEEVQNDVMDSLQDLL